ncbi:hypothetical protein CR513_07795, partial [Mucuna pruriens]
MSGTSKSSSSFSSLSSSSDSGSIVATPVVMAKGVTSGSSSSMGLGEEHFEWVHEDVLSYHSDMADFEVESLSQQEEWVHGPHPPQFALTHYSPSERVCHIPRKEESDFIYLYETIILDLGVSFPLDHFTAEVLRTIGITPSQLNPNGWVALQAFKIVCQALMVTPFASVFLNHYTILVGKKVGWVSLAPLPNNTLGEASFCSDRQSLPLYWKLPMRDQVTPKSQLSSKEKAVFQLLDELPRTGVLKKKGLDMDALIRRAKGILSTEHVSTQKESNAVEVVSVSSSTEKESVIFVAEKESAHPVAEKESIVPIVEKESTIPVAEKLVLNSPELVAAPIMTEKSSASLMVDEGPVQTGEGPMPEASNKRKANTTTAEEVLGKKGKGAMFLSISQGQPKGKVVVTSSPKLPLGGLPCYTAPSGTNSLWGPEANIHSMLQP